MEHCSALKAQKLIIYNITMARPGGFILSKPDKEIQISHDLTHIWNLKETILQKLAI